jgi:hypothetical protein
MAYSRGDSTNIIVGAAALFTYNEGVLTDSDLPAYADGKSFKDSLSGYTGQAAGDATKAADFRNVGYTMNGLEIQFQPDFGEVAVDQVLDVAKLFKQGMQVNLNTTFAESTLENLLFAIAGKGDESANPDLTALSGTGIGAGSASLNLSAGDIGECPVERGLVAVGPGTGDCAIGSSLERIYVAYRALSIENVSVSAKRDEATMFEVSFRLLPNDDASYGKIVDRTIPAAS